MSNDLPEVGWDIPGWDWDQNDYSWLSSQSGIHKDGASIFFIHGGRIRHQAHVPEGNYTLEEFTTFFNEKTKDLDDAYLCWTNDTGGGIAGLWVEGTRVPNEEDLERLKSAREHQERKDRMDAGLLKQRHPEWFKEPA